MEDLLKGGKGSGNHNHAGRPGKVGGSAPQHFTDINLPDSSYINTPEEAREYFAQHLNGRHNLIVHRKSGAFKVTVDMTVNANHAYTVDELKAKTKGRQTGKRLFDKERARQMDQIFKVISYPTRIYEHFNNDLFIVRQTTSGVQAVALEWRKDHYEFRSSHHWDTAYYRQRQKYLRPAPVRGEKIEEASKDTSPTGEAPVLEKSSRTSVHLLAYEPNSQATESNGLCPAGHHTGNKRSTEQILSDIDILVKAHGFKEME